MNPFFETEPIEVDRPTPCFWDPELWFSDQPADISEAKRLCSNCDVRTRCRGDAIENNEPWGVWGGLSSRERDKDISSDPASDERYVSAAGTVRRMRALACNGFTQVDLSMRLGMSEHTASNYLRTGATDRFITHQTAQKVAELYEALRNEQGPSNVAAVRARRKGWNPPEAWTAATIDDPDALPIDIDQIGA